MNAYKVDLYAGGGVDSQTATVDIGSQKHFYAWCQISTIDSLADFDKDNAIAFDIYKVDGNPTSWRVAGGDHFGDPNTYTNVLEGALASYGQNITFRLRVMHGGDLFVYGTGIVLVP